MDLQVRVRNLELNEMVREQITGKVNRLGRRLPSIANATVDLARENTRAQSQRVVAQITLDIGGTVLRGEERGTNAVAAVDAVIAVMDRRIERYKGKAYKSERVKKAGNNPSIRTLDLPSISLDEASLEDEIVEAEGRVVRVKRFPIKPMTMEEAAFQMELLGHDFFLFLSSETDEYSVLYKRRDGDYGLIQPELL